jgi:guanylate kinase
LSKKKAKKKTKKKSAKRKPARKKSPAKRRAKKKPVKKKPVKKKPARKRAAAKPRAHAGPRPKPLVPPGLGGILLVLSGPSGAGKSTVAQRLGLADRRIWRSVSMTTRSPRPAETNGIDYYFVTPENFARERSTGSLLESATVHGESYGTPRRPVVERLLQNRDVLLEIDVQGAMQVRRTVGDAVFIFVRPPSRVVLEERLRDRGSETEEAILSRLAVADREMALAAEYDYLIINDDLDRTVSEVFSVIVAERSRSQRRQDLPW